MEQSSPLDIQELLDHCIGLLADSPPDLLACCLVARSWVQMAQSHLFRAPHITNLKFEKDEVALKFFLTLVASPHLIRHVRELDLDCSNGTNPSDKYRAISSIVFTHLETVVLMVDEQPREDTEETITRLMGLPTLRRLGYTHRHFNSPISNSAYLLNHCSPSIRHLEVFLTIERGDSLNFVHDVVPHICIQSLRLNGRVDPLDNPRTLSLDKMLRPFNFSELKALNLDGVLRFHEDKIPKSQIKILNIDSGWPERHSTPTELGAFTGLWYLHLSVQGEDPRTSVIPTLHSLTCSIHTIVISALSSPYPPLSGFVLEQMAVDYYTLIQHPMRPRTASQRRKTAFQPEIGNFFPKLVARNLFRTVWCSGHSQAISARWREVVDQL
ncbi:hypothetical protein R3P38DRAFT_2911190, partial [Favolaschia claudopus]